MEGALSFAEVDVLKRLFRRLETTCFVHLHAVPRLKIGKILVRMD